MTDKKVSVDAHKHLEAKEVPKKEVDPLIHSLNINYDFSNPRRGLAVVINMRYFDFESTQQGEREGTDEDAQAIVDRLLRLGFDVRRYDDLTRRDMGDLMSNLAKEDHSDADCFVCVFLSHGKEGRVYAYDGIVYIDSLLGNFKGDVCPTLAGKPKLFFVQACRGVKFMRAVEVTDSYEEGEDMTDAAPEKTRQIPSEADVLIAYSTVPGYFSWRNNVDGSWFIQAICRVIDDVGTTAELMQMMTYVNRIVAYDFASCTDREWEDNMKQIPSITTRLTKFIYFHPKKTMSNSLEHYPSRFHPRR